MKKLHEDSMANVVTCAEEADTFGSEKADVSEVHLKRAQRCVKIARRQYPKATDTAIENAAYTLMSSTDDELTLIETALDEQGVPSWDEMMKEPAPKQKYAKTKDALPRKVVTLEELSPAAVKGLDAYRAYMRTGDARLFSEGVLYIAHKDPETRGCIELAGVVMGYMLSAGATFEETLKGIDFAHQHNLWVKETPRKVPCEPYPTEYTMGTKEPERQSYRTVYDCTFVG